MGSGVGCVELESLMMRVDSWWNSESHKLAEKVSITLPATKFDYSLVVKPEDVTLLSRVRFSLINPMAIQPV